MSGDVNPFEPWRPPPQPGADDAPATPWYRPKSPDGIQPPPDSGPKPRPWQKKRPQPVTWSSETGADPMEEAEQRRQAQARENFVRACVFFAVMAVPLSLAKVGYQSAFRSFAVAVCLLLAIHLAMKGWYDRGTRRRLGTVLTGVAAAVVCWFAVPTLGGRTYAGLLWDRFALASVPLGQTDEFARRARDLIAAIEEFPDEETAIKEAIAAWVCRTVAVEMEEVEAESATDLTAAVDRLRRFHGALSQVPDGHAQNHLSAGTRKRVYTAYLDREMKQIEGQMQQGDPASIYRLLDDLSSRVGYDAGDVLPSLEVQAKLKGLREQAVRKHLAAAEASLRQLLSRGDLARIATEGERLTGELMPPAKEVDLEKAVRETIDALRREALERRIRAARQQLEAVLNRGDLPRVATLARERTAELKGEANRLKMVHELEPLHDVRAKAFTARLDRARKTLDDLLAKGEHAAVATEGARLWDELADEAAACRRQAEASEQLREPRRAAVAARLDAARQRVRALLVADRYQAIGEAGEQVFRELADEARAVGRQAELWRFRDSCRVFADLARRAKVADGK